MKKMLKGLIAGAILLAASAAPALDNGVDPNNLGKGYWVWYLSTTYTNLGLAQGDIDGLMQKLDDMGCDWVTVKSANGTGAWAQFTPELVQAAHNKGLKIFGWSYVYGDDPVNEGVAAIDSLNKGADGFIIDAEGEFKTKYTQATTLVNTIRGSYPNRFLAYAPYAYIQYHGTYPWIEFGSGCDRDAAVLLEDHRRDAGADGPRCELQLQLLLQQVGRGGKRGGLQARDPRGPDV
jgi:hypothetical protein